MRKRFLTNFLLILAILAVVGGSATVIAYMFRETQVETNELIPAEVSCSVQEKINADGEKSEITVKNTGNIDAYIRVRLVSYWVNSDGTVSPKNSPTLSLSFNSVNWIQGANNTFYYKYKVPSGNTTLNLLSDNNVISWAETSDDGTTQYIDVFAEAIQAEPAGAVNNSWKEVVVGNDGKLDLNTP